MEHVPGMLRDSFSGMEQLFAIDARGDLDRQSAATPGQVHSHFFSFFDGAETPLLKSLVIVLRFSKPVYCMDDSIRLLGLRSFAQCFAKGSSGSALGRILSWFDQTSTFESSPWKERQTSSALCW
jgi:hypothetical protein